MVAAWWRMQGVLLFSSARAVAAANTSGGENLPPMYFIELQRVLGVRAGWSELPHCRLDPVSVRHRGLELTLRNAKDTANTGNKRYC